MRSRLEKWDKIEIFWLDSFSSPGWQYESDIGADENHLHHASVGYFLKQTDKSVSIVQSKSDYKRDNHEIGSVMTIPKVAIKKIIKI